MSEEMIGLKFFVEQVYSEQLSKLLEFVKKIAGRDLNYVVFSRKEGYKEIDVGEALKNLEKGIELIVPLFEGSNAWNKNLEIDILKVDKRYVVLAYVAEAIFKDEGELVKKYFEDYLTVLKEIYNIFHPDLGILQSEDAINPPDFRWVDAIKLEHLAPIMFFGPKYVKKYGKTPLLKIYGAWKIEAFKDGGIMIVLNPLYFVEGRREKFLEACGKLLAIFGIQPDEQMRWYDW